MFLFLIIQKCHYIQEVRTDDQLSLHVYAMPGLSLVTVRHMTGGTSSDPGNPLWSKEYRPDRQISSVQKLAPNADKIKPTEARISTPKQIGHSIACHSHGGGSLAKVPKTICVTDCRDSLKSKLHHPVHAYRWGKTWVYHCRAQKQPGISPDLVRWRPISLRWSTNLSAVRRKISPHTETN